MKKDIMNFATMKKALNKSEYICYYQNNSNIYFWNNNGYFAGRMPEYAFAVLKTKLKADQIILSDSIPEVVKNAFENSENEIVYTNFIFNDTNKNFAIFKNNNDFIPVDMKYFNIIENAFLYRQRSKYSPIIAYYPGNIELIVMPCQNSKLTYKINNTF